jgi:hypothetical protein
MTLAEAVVKFKSEGVDQVKSATDSVGKSLDSLSKKADNAGLSIKNIAAGNVVSTILTRLADGAFNLGQEVLQMGMSFQTTNAQFEALGMNANATRDFIGKVAAASTLTTKELTGLATSVQLSGFNIYRVLPAFAKLADLAGKDQDKLQGMVRLLNVLKTGARPDQELLQSLKMPTLLFDAGLKFNKGKLVGDIDQALEAVIKVIESKTKGVSGAMNKTFEASFSSLVDQFDRIKESLGVKILDWAKPWVDALTKVLSALTSGGVWDRTLNQFFQLGYKSNKELIDGITSKEGMNKIINFVGDLTAYIAFIPERLKNLFDNIIPIVKNALDKLAEDPRIKGMLVTLEAIGKAAGKQEKGTSVYDAVKALYKEGSLPFDTISGNYQALDPETRRLIENQRKYMDFQKQRGRGTKSYEDVSNDIVERERKFAEQNKMILRGIVFGTGTSNYETGGNIRLPGDKLPPREDDSSGKSKTKKVVEKQASLLEMIVQNTQKANELTLRNLTYGGGQLAQQGISQVQMASNRSVKSPQISATNDISRGVEKMIRGYTNSNNLNFSFRRA